jgi:hypothetical protein
MTGLKKLEENHERGLSLTTRTFEGADTQKTYSCFLYSWCPWRFFRAIDIWDRINKVQIVLKSSIVMRLQCGTTCMTNDYCTAALLVQPLCFARHLGKAGTSILRAAVSGVPVLAGSPRSTNLRQAIGNSSSGILMSCRNAQGWLWSRLNGKSRKTKADRGTSHKTSTVGSGTTKRPSGSRRKRQTSTT